METHQEKLIGIVRYQLFGGAKPQIDENELPAILKEASQQTVYTMIYPFLRDAIIKYSPEKFAQKNEQFLGNVLQNTANFFEHDELHRLMTENNIPYSAIKGLASAYYYPEASLRDLLRNKRTRFGLLLPRSLAQGYGRCGLSCQRNRL